MYLLWHTAFEVVNLPEDVTAGALGTRILLVTVARGSWL
jgi:hypothetical protein